MTANLRARLEAPHLCPVIGCGRIARLRASIEHDDGRQRTRRGCARHLWILVGAACEDLEPSRDDVENGWGGLPLGDSEDVPA